MKVDFSCMEWIIFPRILSCVYFRREPKTIGEWILPLSVTNSSFQGNRNRFCRGKSHKKQGLLQVLFFFWSSLCAPTKGSTIGQQYYSIGEKTQCEKVALSQIKVSGVGAELFCVICKRCQPQQKVLHFLISNNMWLTMISVSNTKRST